MVRPIRPEEYQFPTVTNFADPLREIYKRQLDQKDRFHDASRERDRQMVAASEDDLNLVKSLAKFAPTVKKALDKRQAEIDKKKDAEAIAEWDEIKPSDPEISDVLEYRRRVRDGEIKESLVVKELAKKWQERNKNKNITEDYVDRIWKLTSGNNIRVQENAFRLLSQGHAKHWTDRSRGPQDNISWAEYYESADAAGKREILKQYRHERFGKYNFNPEAYVEHGQKGWQDFEKTITGVTKAKKNAANKKFDDLQENDFLANAFLDPDSSVGSNQIAEQYQIVLAGFSKEDPDRNRRAQAIIYKRVENLKGLVSSTKLREILDNSNIPIDMLHSGMKADEDGNISLSKVFFGKDTHARKKFFEDNDAIWGPRIEAKRKALHQAKVNEGIAYARNPENQKKPDYLEKIAAFQGEASKLGSESEVLARYLEADLTPDAIQAKEDSALRFIDKGNYKAALETIEGIPQLEAKYNETWEKKEDAWERQGGNATNLQIEDLVYKNPDTWNKEGRVQTDSGAVTIARELKERFAELADTFLSSDDPETYEKALELAYKQVIVEYTQQGAGDTLGKQADKLAALNDPTGASRYKWFLAGKDDKGVQRKSGFWIIENETNAQLEEVLDKFGIKESVIKNSSFVNNSAGEKDKRNKQIVETLNLGEFYTNAELQNAMFSQSHRIIPPEDLYQIGQQGYITQDVVNLSEVYNLPLTSILESAKISAENDEETELPTGLEENFKKLDVMIDAEQVLIDELPPDLLRVCRLGQVSPKQLHRCAAILDKDIENLPTRFNPFIDEDKDQDGLEHLALNT